MPSATLILPGRLDTRTGGYGYDRHIVLGLRALGWEMAVRELDDSFPSPTAAARAHAADVLARLPDGATVLLDGLALGVLPEEAGAHAPRLHLVALVHHPLAAETSLEPGLAHQLRDSERRALASVSTVVVTSCATAALMSDYGVGPDRVVVVVPGTNVAPLARGSGRPGVHMLCVATLIPRKGHEVLIRALGALEHLEWRLTCVGSFDRHPETVAALRAQVERAGLGDRISFAGESDTDGLSRHYDTADLFVLPTLFEGYGMVVAEALARGLPVVATDTGAIGELVGDTAGMLVPPGDAGALTDALHRVITDRAWRARLAEGARAARAQLPTWQQACAQVADVLRQAGAGAGGR